MPIGLKDKIALVTGGNRGIGLAIACALVKAGCTVVFTGRDRAAIKKTQKSLGANAVGVRCDICSHKDIASLFTCIKKRLGRVDFLINNAGAAHPLKPVSELPARMWDSVIATNLTGLFLVTQAALPLMPPGSVVINNLSIAALQPFSGMSAYNAAKAGALAFTNTLRLETRQKGIRVTGLIPGAVDTDIWQQFWPEAPKKNMVSPTQIAEAVLNVLSLPAGTTVEQLQIGPSCGAL